MKCWYCGHKLNELFNDLLHQHCRDRMLIDVHTKLGCLPIKSDTQQ